MVVKETFKVGERAVFLGGLSDGGLRPWGGHGRG